MWRCLLDPTFSRFSRTPTCDRRTDGHIQIQATECATLRLFHRVSPDGAAKVYARDEVCYRSHCLAYFCCVRLIQCHVARHSSTFCRASSSEIFRQHIFYLPYVDGRFIGVKVELVRSEQRKDQAGATVTSRCLFAPCVPPSRRRRWILTLPLW